MAVHIRIFTVWWHITSAIKLTLRMHGNLGLVAFFKVCACPGVCYFYQGILEEAYCGHWASDDRLIIRKIMLFGEATRYGGGITLFGDFYDLRSIRDTVYFLSKGVPFTPTLEDFLLGLAYDVRHAHQGQRIIQTFGRDNREVTYYGVNILWPVFLSQVGMLRWSAGFHPTNRRHQADLFLLEDCAEAALTNYEPVIGKECFHWLMSFSGFPETYLPEYILYCTKKYVCEGRSGKTRFKKLPKVLQSLDPLSDEYNIFKEQVTALANERNCAPENIQDWGTWPQFKL